MFSTPTWAISQAGVGIPQGFSVWRVGNNRATSAILTSDILPSPIDIVDEGHVILVRWADIVQLLPLGPTVLHDKFEKIGLLSASKSLEVVTP
jgi:hypothetical protein